MLIDFLIFSVKRYARFCSYIAAFLAGLAFTVQGSLFWCPLAASIVLGSLAAYEGSHHDEGSHHSVRPAGRVRTDARPSAGAIEKEQV